MLEDEVAILIFFHNLQSTAASLIFTYGQGSSVEVRVDGSVGQSLSSSKITVRLATMSFIVYFFEARLDKILRR